MGVLYRGKGKENLLMHKIKFIQKFMQNVWDTLIKAEKREKNMDNYTKQLKEQAIKDYAYFLREKERLLKADYVRDCIKNVLKNITFNCDLCVSVYYKNMYLTNIYDSETTLLLNLVHIIYNTEFINDITK